MSYTVCKKCKWWEADHRRGLCCRKCGVSYPDLRKSATTGGAKTGWYTIESNGSGRAKRKPQPNAWQGWKNSSWTGWEDTARAEVGSDKELISRLLQQLKEGKPLTDELETLASRSVEPAENTKTDKEQEQQCWKTLGGARIELKRKQDQLAKKTKAVEKAQEFLKAAEEAAKEAKAEQDTANAAVDAATAAYAVFKTGHKEEEEDEPDEQDKLGDEELAGKLAEHEESAKKLKDIMEKRKLEAEARAGAMETDDNKRKDEQEQQEREDKAAKHRRLSDELEQAKLDAEKADKAAKEAIRTAQAATAAKAAADKATARG